MNPVGILYYARTGTEGYFFCNKCAERFSAQDNYYRKVWVYEEQFPSGLGQKCHTINCPRILKEGTNLYDKWQDVQIPEELLRIL